jgi:hypothetical protein
MGFGRMGYNIIVVFVSYLRKGELYIVFWKKK